MRLDDVAAWLTAAALTLPGSAAAAGPPCPAGGQAEPSEVALSLKNVALDLRDGGSWTKSTRAFRDAADELAECESLDDERLRWSLWAVEAFDKSAASPEEQREMVKFVERQLEILDGHPASRTMADLPRLREARARLQPAERPNTGPELASDSNSPAPSDRRPPRSRAPAAVLGVGGAVLVAGVAVLIPFASRARKLDAELNQRLYPEFMANGCHIDSSGDSPDSSPATCNSLRAEREELVSSGRTAAAVAYTGAAFVAIGGIVTITGLVLLLRDRRRNQQSRLQVIPTIGGVRLEGRF